MEVYCGMASLVVIVAVIVVDVNAEGVQGSGRDRCICTQGEKKKRENGDAKEASRGGMKSTAHGVRPMSVQFMPKIGGICCDGGNDIDQWTRAM